MSVVQKGNAEIPLHAAQDLTPSSHAVRLEKSTTGTAPNYPAAAFFVTAAVGLGWAVHMADGAAIPESMAAFTASVAAAIIGFAFFWKPMVTSDRPFAIVLGVGLSLQLVVLSMKSEREPTQTAIQASILGAICLVAILAGLTMSQSDCGRRISFWTLLIIFFALAIWVLRRNPLPSVDLIFYHKIGIQALRRGISPYISIYPDIYTPQDSLRYYGPGISRNGMLTVGYPYLPLNLVLTAPAELLFGDFRFAQVVAMIATAIFIAHTRPSRWSFAAAILFLFTPSSFFFIEQGWIEPFILLFLALSAWCWFHARPMLPITLGLFFATKQYLLIAFPLILLLQPDLLSTRKGRVFLTKLVSVAAATILPVALLDFPAFYRSTIWMFLRSPLRPDSLSFVTWFSIGGKNAFPILGFILPVCLIGICVWLSRKRHTFSAFLTSFVLVMFFFFAFNKQAFANYYHLIIGSLCLLIAMLAAEKGPTSLRLPVIRVLTAKPVAAPLS